MKLLKPHWVHHDDKPIFSVDVHQAGFKFATGGQGNDSGRVVIWNLLPVISEKAELDPLIPKLLCQMDNHLACVNCVRWSQNGRMLASGSDDKLVMIWKMSKGSSGVFSTGGITKNAETWKCAFTLRGHAGDVLDLAWSPNDRWLASCSVDNTIIVWNADSFPVMTTILKGHLGLVKGVTWDPVGKFLASQSDDRSVKIWKTVDWSCSNTITEPFEECGGTTHILRLSWSPDGQYLVSAHAMNGGGPTAQIIEREGWKCDKDFVGHRKAITCVRFHNSILRKQSVKSNKAQQYCCLAVGSRDRSLSVWMTALQRPLVVIHDLFQDSVLDLSWGADKYILLACSGDGSVACLQFTEKELGTPLTEDEKNSLYQRIYGRSTANEVNSSLRQDIIVEHAELLNVVNEKFKPPIILNLKNNIDINDLQTVKEKNVEYKTILNTPQKAINKQIETITADGKRRITPMFIPLNETYQSNIESTREIISSSRNSTTINEENIENNSIKNHTDISTESPKSKTLDNRLTKLVAPPAKTNTITNVPGFPNQQQTSSSNLEKKQTISARLNIANTIKTSKLESVKTYNEYRIHVQNNAIQTTLGDLCKTYCWAINTNERLWELILGSAVCNFNLCAQYVLFCSIDGSIRIFNIKTGSSVLPTINLSTAAIQSSFCPFSCLVGVITECGQLRIWNIKNQEIFISSSCTDILKSGTIIQFSINDKGVPFLLFSNGHSYAYCQNMQSWLVLSSKDPIIRYGLHTTIPKDIQKNSKHFPLMTVQSAFSSLGINFLDPNTNDWQSSAKLIFIENQIKLSEAINSSDELKYWYSVLGYHLSNCGTEKRIRLILDSLLVSLQGMKNDANRKLLSVDKIVLLEFVLNALKLNPRWQRIYMEYTEQLKFIKNSEK